MQPNDVQCSQWNSRLMKPLSGGIYRTGRLGVLFAGLIGLACLLAASWAADPAKQPAVELQLELPRLRVSEYHRPYVAIWIEDEKHEVVANLSVWYQLRKGDEGSGTKWLPDLRQWWRRTGRSLDMPVDGVSGATRPSGKHKLRYGAERLKNLKAGKHVFVVEASREVGGREVVKLPFEWPLEEAKTFTQKGEKELGQVVLQLRPVSQP